MSALFCTNSLLYCNFIIWHFRYNMRKPDFKSEPTSLSSHSYFLYCDINGAPQLISYQFQREHTNTKPLIREGWTSPSAARKTYYYCFVFADLGVIFHPAAVREKSLGFVMSVSETHCLEVVLFFFPSPPPTGQREIFSIRGQEKEGRASAPNRHFVTRLFTDTTGHGELFLWHGQEDHLTILIYIP